MKFKFPLFLILLVVSLSAYAGLPENRQMSSTALVGHALQHSGLASSSKLSDASRAVQNQRRQKPQVGRFEKVTDGVLDHEQGVVWAANDNGANINWTDAEQYC